MPIFRGVGGSGDASTDAYASQVALSAQTATTKANEASAYATAAAASATAAAASEAGVDADAIAAEAAKVAAEAAQAAAETAQTGAETAETNAETAETNAAASASSASTSATSASNSATTATTKASEASTAATNAANSATAAATSATNAATSASNAAASESAVASDAAAAASSASAALASETASAASESAAATSASNASTSETNAASSASAASTSATNAATSETNAATSASSASTSATTATTKASEASASASAAATSESNAATSASNAATSETNAATSASNASTSASNASTSETNASNSATAAAASAADAAATAASIGDLDSLSDVTITSVSTGEVLKYDGAAWVNGAATGGIANVVEDTTPQLGGNLDLNSNNITGTGNLNITGTVTADSVGIGTVSPEHKLSVFGDSSGNRTEIGIDNIDQRLVLGAYFETGVGQYSTIQSTNNAETSAQGLVLQPDGGNVGIGTSSPNAKLEIGGSTSGQTLLFSNTASNSGARLAGAVSYRTATGYTGKVLESNITGSFDDIYDLRLFTANTGASAERMRIDSSGKVGIGNSSPSSVLASGSDLVVGNTDDNHGITIVASPTNFSSIHFADAFTTGAASYSGVVHYSHAADFMNFYTASNERMRLDASGNVNIKNGNLEIGTYSTTETGSLLLNGSTANKQSTIHCTNGNLHLDSNTGDNTYINFFNGNAVFFGAGAAAYVNNAGHFSGSVYYDSNDSGYYVDPNGTSVLGTLYMAGLLATRTNSTSFAASNDTTFSVRGNTSYPAVMSFHRLGAYAANFGLDTDNQLKYGGWSVGDVHPVMHDGVFGGSVTTATNGGGVNYVYVDATVSYTPTRGSCGNHVYQCWNGSLTLNLNDSSWQRGDIVVLSNVRGAAAIVVNASVIYLPNGGNDNQVTWNSTVGSFRLCKYSATTGYWMVLP